MLKVYRQGDVCLVPHEGFGPLFVKFNKQKTGLLRKGEHGGMHILKGIGAKVLVVKANEVGIPKGTKYADVPKGGTVVHGEHHELTIPPGFYEVRVQREDLGGSLNYVGD